MASVLKVENISHTNGTSALTIDSGGSLNLPKQTRFYGSKTSKQTIPRGTAPKVTGFGLNEIDTQTAFDGTTFTAPVAGDYFIFTNLHVDMTPAGNDGENHVAYIYVNGSSIAEGSFRNDSTRDVDNISLNVSAMATLAVNDTVEVYVYIVDSSGGDGQVLGSFNSNFGGYLLG